MPETFEVDRVDRIADILFGVATGGGLIGYGPLARRVDTRPDFLSHPLDQVSRRAAERGEPMWSALVVSKDTGRPNTGFYAMARRLRPEYQPSMMRHCGRQSANAAMSRYGSNERRNPRPVLADRHLIRYMLLSGVAVVLGRLLSWWCGSPRATHRPTARDTATCGRWRSGQCVEW
jgi:hypothetical protein